VDASMSICRLDQVHKFHSSISELINDLELSPMPIRYSGKLSKEALRLLFELSPIHVIKNGKGQYVCIGGIKQLLLARAKLPPEHEIPILLHNGKSVDKAETKRRLLVELYHQPALMSLAFGDTKMAKEMFKKFEAPAVFQLEELKLDTLELQAYWSGTSKRTIQRGRE